MLYSIFVFTLGVFVGQEYDVPSVKNFTTNALSYIKSEKTTTTTKETEDFPTKLELVSSWIFGLLKPKTSPSDKTDKNE